MIWRRDGTVNDRLELVARNLVATFVDPNTWIREGDIGRVGLHLNRNVARQLGDRHCRVCRIGGECWKELNNWQHAAGSEFSVRIPDGSRNTAIQEYPKLVLETAEAGRFTGIEMFDIGGKKRKSRSRDGLHTAVSTSKYEGKSLLLLQVHCRGIQ